MAESSERKKLEELLSEWQIVKFDEETKSYISHCPLLNIYSQGQTEAEAISALKSAVKLYVEVLKKNSYVK